MNVFRFIKMMLFATTLLLSDIVFAGVDDAYPVNLRVQPAQLIENQTIRVLANTGGCNVFDFPHPDNREVDVADGVIQVTVPFHYNATCIIPLATFEWRLDGVPAGNYRLELYGEHPDDFPRALLQAIDITVSPAPLPAIVPAMERSGTIALICGFLLFGALVFSSAGGSRR